MMGSPENEPGRSDYEGPQHRFTQGMPPLRRRTKDEGPQRRVTVRSFYIGKYEVTQAQWRAVMGGSPSAYKGDDLPVENVTWDVLRGGGWNVAAASCRSANRDGASPINRSDFLGFRLVRMYR